MEILRKCQSKFEKLLVHMKRNFISTFFCNKVVCIPLISFYCFPFLREDHELFSAICKFSLGSEICDIFHAAKNPLWRQSCAREKNMVDKVKKRVPWMFCVAGGPKKVSCTNTKASPGGSMHLFPIDKAMRIQWLKFVHKRRPDFKSTMSSAVCQFRPVEFHREAGSSQLKR